MTSDRLHLNRMRLPLDPGSGVKSVTLTASPDEDWGLLVVAVTLEGADESSDEAAREGSSNVWRDAQVRWENLSGYPDVEVRRDRDPRGGERIYAPTRLVLASSSRENHARHEIELTLSGDPAGKPRVGIESDGMQIVSNYCLGGVPESMRFSIAARDGRLALDLIPGPNCETGRLPEPQTGYGIWRAPQGNFVRVERVRVRSVGRLEHSAATQPPLRYGWLLPAATGEAGRGGLVVDHEDALGPMLRHKWTAGGFRADLPDGRYRVTIRHTTYGASSGSVFVDLFANDQKVLNCVEVDDEVHQFDAVAAASAGITLTWRQPKVHARCPRYAIRSFVFEPMDQNR
jgi:hypothetical protein